ncbi:MAG: acyltransferase [Zoogloeaceae bacterium]|jgi:peptidoglycan/LPS O-acetylase OafA/YrhL|nr:acyltransferase [Zoogloeaceae bacterium]
MYQQVPAHPVYRPDIDGLRAFAVLSVMGFHALPRYFPGGFIGVDIFFVISGYLITRIILKKCLDGNFSFPGFYYRRIRRIFPALLLVLVTSLIAGYFLCFANEFVYLGMNTAAGILFLANASHARIAANYFAPVAEQLPLLHLWSLGIEEQFYLVWPLVLAFITKRPRWILAGILSLLILSFIINIAIFREHSTIAFYLPFGRAWELLAGGALAYVALKHKPGYHVSHLFSMTGFVFLLGALIFLDRTIQFPGYAALLPVVGTVSLIAAGPQAFFNRYVLSRKTWVGIGLISFPLYLWHWPLLAFPRSIVGGESPDGLRIAGVFLSFPLAWLTYQYAEKKLRFHPWRFMPWLLLATGIGVAALGGLIFYEKGWPGRFEFTRDEIHSNADRDWETKTQGCASRFAWNGNYCRDFSWDEPDRWIVFTGDSHTNGWVQDFPASKDMGLTMNTGLVALAKDGCLSWRGMISDVPNCPSFDDVIDSVGKIKAEQIVIIGRYAWAYEGGGFGAEFDGKYHPVAFNLPDQMPVSENKAAFVASLRATLDAWRVLGKKVVFAHQTPELGFTPIHSYRPFAAQIMPDALHRISIPRAIVEERQYGYRQAVAEVLQDYPEVRVFDPMDDFCDMQNCYLREKEGGKLFYYDDDHLGYYGSELLLKRLIPFLQKEARK